MVINTQTTFHFNVFACFFMCLGMLNNVTDIIAAYVASLRTRSPSAVARVDALTVKARARGHHYADHHLITC